MKKRTTIIFAILVLMILFLCVLKIGLILNSINYSVKISVLEGIFLLNFSVLFWILYEDVRKTEKNTFKSSKYESKLSSSLIWQSRNECFYLGDTVGSARIITREISNTTEVDRVSVWIYGESKKTLKCQNLYEKKENRFHEGTELRSEDFLDYFKSLENDPIITADDAETHPSTSCFTYTYLRPLGIKSMLDVPIWFKGSVIGVICLENFTRRSWKQSEVTYAQMLSSLYSFSFSVRESYTQEKRTRELQDFVNTAALVSVADSKGKITYVNKKFTDVSGWELEEVIGKDHNIVNSGIHTKDFWNSMYRKVLAGEIWNSVVANKAKDGHIYYVDTYIKAYFDDYGKLKEFSSIRQDVTDIIKSSQELEKKNTYLEHASKIIRHDMHSGINTYIPRGISSLERRLSEEQIKELKLEAPIKMIKEGLRHTQKVYKGVYEFTNLVKKDSILDKKFLDLSQILEDYLSATAYRSQVIFNNLGFASVNEALFCTAIDNLIRNGLKYNDSLSKTVKIIRHEDFIFIEDNGRGLSSEEFKHLSKPYTRKHGQKESGTGLGLNICLAILGEHGFGVDCEKIPEGGSRIKINISNG